MKMGLEIEEGESEGEVGESEGEVEMIFLFVPFIGPKSQPEK